MEVQKKRGLSRSSSRARSVAVCGLTIALSAVSAWISIPLGPVPFTLQVFVMVFALVALSPRECLAAIAGYLLLGAIGLPVFSSMRGGIGVLLGPTGGFLWGYLLGAALALGLACLLRRVFAGGSFWGSRGSSDELVCTLPRGLSLAIDAISAVLFMLIAYVCGCAQYALVANVSMVEAALVAVVPFLVVDAIKIVAAVLVARTVRRTVFGNRT